ncbi:NUDIX hydrolase [Anaerotignum sp. MB30-C6]|uniref:NUDIX hydrolase n=1 Tax=Anaerotignum sp. MB30-C6 TaxID=3070814 RepID=UPI0027DC7AF8|nr:NUDIX hydrolase [Anaerotignum sp. MB30-C6]WMI81720.1 NUDIX hydrolase [Anaerotignum sp. MB30-C6]
MSYRVLESNETYIGRILRVTIDKIEMPDKKPAFRETVLRDKDAAAVLPILDDGRILFVRQYRHAFGELLLEIPAGVFDCDECAEVCVKRELEEETGKIAGRLEFLCEMYPTVGFCSEKIFIYFAFDLTQGQQKLDPDEFIELESYTLDQALEMIYKGEIKDGKTIAALFAYKSKHI